MLVNRYRVLLGSMALICGALGAVISTPRGEAASRLGVFLERSCGLEVTDESVSLVTETSWPLALGYRTVVFLGANPREPRDLYRADVRITPTGRPIAVRGLANLTRTSASDEDQLHVLGTRAVTRSRTGDEVVALMLVDLAGESEEIRRNRGPIWRVMWAVRNMVELGTPAGVERHTYQLLEPTSEVELTLGADGLTIDMGGERAIAGLDGDLTVGSDRVEHLPPTEVQASIVPFVVDTVRLVPWIGARGIEWMEYVFFTGMDLGRQGLEAVGASSTSGEDVAHEMGVEDHGSGATDAIELADLPDVGFPPAELQPIRPDPVDGEGRWRTMTDERFVRINPGAPPCFATTFIRPDLDRGYAETFIVVWDPRQVELYPVAGTVEPMSATGVRGSGLAPRDEIERMVAGFNGGFQATHGEYGMMMEGTLFIPPKGYAATIATLADGRTGFGTWNEDVSVIPPAIVAFRQNMTALVQDGRVNPYARDWWGAAPPGSRDPTYTQRSGICLTEEGFAAYFWGTSLSPEALGAAMLAARCTHGTHLDMNAMLTGFEFYHVAPPAELPPRDRELDPTFEREGRVPHREEMAFRSRRLVRGMQQINFPRYIRRDTRDFFWLKLRNVLPGAPLAPVVEPVLAGEGAWQIKGLPVGGFPPAFARSFLRPDRSKADKRVEIVLIDPYVVRAARGRPGDWPARGPGGQVGPAGLLAAIVPGSGAVVVDGRGQPGDGVSIGLVGSELVRPAVVSGADQLTDEAAASAVSIVGPSLGTASHATVAIARHRDGFLIVVREAGGDAGLLASALRIMGVDPDRSVALGTSEEEPGADLVFYAGSGDGRRAAALSGREAPAFGTCDALLLLDGHSPQAVRLFPDMPVVPPGRWLRFLNKREVYLRSNDGSYHHITGEDLPDQAPLYLKRLPGDPEGEQEGQ